MKKFKILSLLVMGLMVFPQLAKADNSYYFNNASIEVAPGEEFSLDFEVDFESGLSSIAADFSFDKDLIEYVGFDSYNVFQSDSCMEIETTDPISNPGNLNVSVSAFSFEIPTLDVPSFPMMDPMADPMMTLPMLTLPSCNFDVSGKLFKLTFRAKDSDGVSEIQVTNNSITVNNIPSTGSMTGASVSIVSPDTEAPAVLIMSPSDTGSHDLVSDIATTTVSGTASDNVAVTDVAVTVNKADGTISSSSAVGTSTWEQVIELTEGENTVEVSAFDEAGNTSQETIIINYTKPVVEPEVVEETPSSSSGSSSGGGIPPYYLSQKQTQSSEEKEPEEKKDIEEGVEVLGLEFEYNEEQLPETSPENENNYSEEVLESYKYAFGAYPETDADFFDLERIINGRWTVERNKEKEEISKEAFKKVYLREASMENSHDVSAIMLMTYGIRPVPGDMDKETIALLYYEAIFNDKPETVFEKNIIRAIAYSGATR